MLSTVLKLFRPRYALTTLLLFGGWQAYSLVQSVTKTVTMVPVTQVEERSLPEGRVARILAQASPAKRVFCWLSLYLLICFASVPLVRWGFERESNVINGLMLAGFCLYGVLSASFLTAFQWSWKTAVLLVLALAVSGAFFVGLASQVERMRVEDMG